jgi:uncharacterized protein (TIGR03067 family)
MAFPRGVVLVAKSIAVVAVVSLLLAQPDAQDAGKKDLQRLQGTWVMAALEVNGKDVGVDKVQGTTLTIKGDRYAVKVKDKVHECVIRLNAKRDPPTIDMIFADAAGDKTHKGIYEIKGDTFRICRGLGADQERPGQLATWPGTNYFVVTWKKQ